MSSNILVLEQLPGDEDGLTQVRDSLAEVSAAGVMFLYTSAEELSEAANRYLWLGSKAGEEIAVIDDFDIEVRYLEMVLTSDDRKNAVVALLSQRLAVVSIDQLEKRARDAFAEDPASLVRLALAAGDGDDETFSLIAEAISTPRSRFGSCPACRPSGRSTAMICGPRWRRGSTPGMPTSASGRSSAARSCGGARSVALILQGSRDPSQRVREASAAALGQVRDPAVVPALLEVLRSDDAVEVREYAMHSLASYEDRAIVEALLDTLSDEGSDNLVRMKAAWQAWRYDDDRVVATLRDAVRCDIDSNVRLWAAESLRLLDRCRGLPRELVPV